MKRIAVVGSGISGLGAAWALRDSADVTLFEANDRVGGHAYTVDAPSDGGHFSVDVGFIVCNPLNYPNFMNFMAQLGVETVASDMSFAVSDPHGFEWSSNPGGLFAQKRNLFRPSFWSLLSEILRFNKTAQADADSGKLPEDLSLLEYLDMLGLSERFRSQYIYPMGAAIWSTPEADMTKYPARSFLTFFNNHRLLHRERPTWRTVAGGSRTYVDRVVQHLGDRVRMNAKVERVTRIQNGVELRVNGETLVFDEVVLASSAPLSRAMLGDGYENQKSILSLVQTVPNTAYLHSDARLMPKRKAAWAAWNVMKGSGAKVSLSYWMNKLQNLNTNREVFVTLNPEFEPAADRIWGKFDFEHPLFDGRGQDGVSAIKRINGRDGIWFAGAWMGHGFHEDGLKSGLRVAISLGAVLPWAPVDAEPYSRDTGASVIATEPRTVVNA